MTCRITAQRFKLYELDFPREKHNSQQKHNSTYDVADNRRRFQTYSRSIDTHRLELSWQNNQHTSWCSTIREKRLIGNVSMFWPNLMFFKIVRNIAIFVTIKWECHTVLFGWILLDKLLAFLNISNQFGHCFRYQLILVVDSLAQTQILRETVAL